MNKKLLGKHNPSKLYISTPNMTTSPVNGYSASGSIGLWNYNTYVQDGRSDSVLTFAEKVYITEIDFGSTIMNNNSWYNATSEAFSLSLNGTTVWSQTINPCSYIGGILYLLSPVLANSAYRNVGYWSGWHNSAGGDYVNANSAQGCILKGYVYK